MMKKYKYDIEEKKAIEFCKEFQKERKWCYEHGIDFRSLDEENTFQKYMKKFKFKNKKEAQDLSTELLRDVAK